MDGHFCTFVNSKRFLYPCRNGGYLLIERTSKGNEINILRFKM